MRTSSTSGASLKYPSMITTWTPSRGREMSEPGGRKTDLDNKVRIAVVQAMVPYELRLGDLEKRQGLLLRAVFGDELAPGLKTRVEAIDGKVDQLLKTQEDRVEDWKRMSEYLDREEERQVVLRAVAKVGTRGWQVLVAVVGLVGTAVGLLGGLLALGIIKW